MRETKIIAKKQDTIIRSLIPYAKHERLLYLVNRLTTHISSEKRMDIINEIKSRACECNRILDLRSMFNNCNPVEHKKINHYLDPASESLFHQQIKDNHGFLNAAVYNAIFEDAGHRFAIKSQSDQNLTNQKSTGRIEKVQLFNLVNENIYTKPELGLNSMCRIFNEPIIGISRMGRESLGTAVKIKHISEHHIIVTSSVELENINDNLIYLWLYDHDKDMNFIDDVDLICDIIYKNYDAKKNCITYKLKVSHITHKDMALTLKEFFSKRKIAVKKCIEQLISPLNDSIMAKGHEQYLVSSTQDIPMICYNSERNYFPSALLKTKNNQDFLNYFNDDDGNFRLSSLFKSKYVDNKLKETGLFDDYVYILRTNINNDCHYSYVFSSELINNKEAQDFVNNIVLLGDYRFIRLQIEFIYTSLDAHVPSSVPNYISPEMTLLNRSVNHNSLSVITKSPYFSLVSDVTNMHKLLDHKKSNKPDKKHSFFYCPMHYLNPVKIIDLPHFVTVKNNDIRTEDRFNVKMPVEITRMGDLPSINGSTINVSTRGLLLSLDTEVKFKAGQDIYVTLAFPNYFNNLVIKNQSYRVLGGDSSGLRLAVNDPMKRHLGKQSIRKFIYQHMEKLTPSGQGENEIYGLQRCMRNIFANNHKSIPFFIQKDFIQWHIASAALNEENKLISLVKNHEEQSAKDATIQLLNNANFRDICLSSINKINSKHPVESFYMIVIPKGTNKIDTFWLRNIEDLSSQRILKNALIAFKKMGNPTVVKIKLSKPSRIFDKYYADELNLLAKISPKSASTIKTKIDSVAGIGEIIDHTEQFLKLSHEWIEHLVADNAASNKIQK